jgi:N-acetylglucosamine-6-phosphate deacetylase
MSQLTLIYNAHLFTPSREITPGWLLIDGSKIKLIGNGQPPAFDNATLQTLDAGGRMLLPGFIDLHVHGAMGHEVMDASAQGLTEMGQFYARHGVTSFLATTWTATQSAIQASLQTVAGLLGPLPGGANLLGVHLEGPYLNPGKCGAQDVTLIRKADRTEVLEYLNTDLVRLMAVAPEFKENLWLIDECVRRGIAVAAGHTNATFEEMEIAVAHGVRQVTHCYNAMTPLTHRAPGVVGAALAFPEIKCELIADNIHVHPAVLKTTQKVKGTDGVVLITDAIRGTGLPEGDYPIDTRVITVKNGSARLPDGTLAGSILTMDRALGNFIQATQRPLAELWPATSLNAARQIGESHRKGSLEVGKDADLVLVDPNYNVVMTLVMGNIVYQYQG